MVRDGNALGLAIIDLFAQSSGSGQLILSQFGMNEQRKLLEEHLLIERAANNRAISLSNPDFFELVESGRSS